MSTASHADGPIDPARSARSAEDPERLLVDRARGCEEMQEYLLSRPLEAKSAAEFLRARIPR